MRMMQKALILAAVPLLVGCFGDGKSVAGSTWRTHDGVCGLELDVTHDVSFVCSQGAIIAANGTYSIQGDNVVFHMSDKDLVFRHTPDDHLVESGTNQVFERMPR